MNGDLNWVVASRQLLSRMTIREVASLVTTTIATAISLPLAYYGFTRGHPFAGTAAAVTPLAFGVGVAIDVLDARRRGPTCG